MQGAQRRYRRGHGVRVRSVVVGQRRRFEMRGRQAAQASPLPAHIRAEEHRQAEKGARGGRGPRGRQGRGGRRGQVVQAAGPGEREEETGEEEGETGHADTRLHNGQLHSLLAAVLRPLHRETPLPERQDTDPGVRHRFLARLHELCPQPLHIHRLQQGLPQGFPQDTLQIIPSSLDERSRTSSSRQKKRESRGVRIALAVGPGWNADRRIQQEHLNSPPPRREANGV